MKHLRLALAISLLLPLGAFADSSVDDAFRQAQSADRQKEKNTEAAQQAREKAQARANADKVRSRLIAGTAAALGSPVAKMGTIHVDNDILLDAPELASSNATVSLKDGRTCKFSFDTANGLFEMGSTDYQSAKDARALAKEIPALQGLIPDAQFQKLRNATSGVGGLFSGSASVQLAYSEVNLDLPGMINDWNVTTECYLGGKKSEMNFSAVSYAGNAHVYPENDELTQAGEEDKAPVEPEHHDWHRHQE